ncbi:MAG: MMPL family transporter [Spirochaetaceae bacterium]|jgi:predicted RND superfamily exporter protein|nr:MMPL family transporter [Spirochaetaceae bacterium]
MKQLNWQSLGEKGVLRLWWFWILLILLLLIPGYGGIKKLGMDSSNESFMPQNDPLTLKNEEFKEIFGNEEFFYILVEAPEIYSSETLNRIDDLEQQLLRDLPFVKDSLSLISGEFMESQEGFLQIESLADSGFPQNDEQMQELRQSHLDSLLFPGRIISSQADRAGIMISLEEIPDQVWAEVQPGYSPFNEDFLNPQGIVHKNDLAEEPGTQGNWILLEDPRKDIAAALKVIVAQHQREDFQLRITGMPLIDYEVDLLTAQESGFFGGLALLCAALLLVVLFRDIRALISPLLVFALTLFFLFALMGYTGMKLSILSIIMVPLLLVISVSYSIHMITQIRSELAQGQSRREAVIQSYGHSAWPCLLTAITTAAGFISFLFVPMKPIGQLGLQAALGTLMAFFLVMVLVPLFYFPGKSPRIKEDSQVNKHEKNWKRWNDLVYSRGTLITLVAVVLSLVAFWGALKIRPSSDMLEIIGQRAAFVEDTSYVSQFLGGAYSAEILIELPRENMGRQPEVLQALEEAGELAMEYDQVSLSFSLADLVLELDRVLEEKPPQAAEIPQDPYKLAQYLLLYEMSGGDSLADWVDFDYRTLRLSVLFGTAESSFGAFSEEMISFLQERMPPGTVITLTGDMPVMVRMMDLLIESQIRSCLAALGFIALLLILILGSLRRGLLAVIPNLFPILMTLGLMGWLGYALDFVTAMTAPMLMGIAVDDTLHYFLHYRRERSQTQNPREASRRTFLSVGNALVFTSIVLTGGFILFAFSRMRSLQHLGILTAVGIASALLADLFLSPLLLGHFDKATKNIGINKGDTA